MAKLFQMALEEELEINNAVTDEVTDSNPDHVLELTDIETATEEFNYCRNQLYKYVEAMEEATETVEKLTDQVAENNRLIEEAGDQDVSDIDMTIATESIHNIADTIGYEGFNGIKLSHEGYRSNKERLRIANEGASDMIASIIEAIKKFFTKIIEFLKKLYIKFMSWLNPYDKKLVGLKKDFHNIFYKGNVLIDKQLVLEILNVFPYLADNSNPVTDLKSLLKNRLVVGKWFEHLKPGVLESTISDIISGVFIEKQANIPYLDTIVREINTSNKNSGEVVAAITSFKGREVKYIPATKNKDGKYTLGEIKSNGRSNSSLEGNIGDSISNAATMNKLSDLSMSSRDFSDLIDNVSKNLTSNLKEFNGNILKLQDKCKEMLDNMGSHIDETIKNNLKTIQYIGGRMSVDMCLSIMGTIKDYIKIMAKIYSETVSLIPNYRILIDCYNKNGIKAELRYINEITCGKKYPYVYSKDIFDHLAKQEVIGSNVDAKNCRTGGYCLLPETFDAIEKLGRGKSKQYDAYLDCLEIFKEKNIDLSNITCVIHLNSDCLFMDPTFVYFHEMGHAIMDQKENIDSKFLKAYFDTKLAGVMDGDEHYFFNYTENPIEVQADAFGCLMTGGTWKDTWYNKFKLKGLIIINIYGYETMMRQSLNLSEEEIAERREKYKKLFAKCTEDCKKWAKAGLVTRIKIAIKSKF